MKPALFAPAALGAIVGAACAASPSPQQLAAGERAYQKCYSCHALEPGKNDLDGPSLHRIIGRPIAVEPFAYSPALKRFAQQHPRWTPELLDRFIADPEALAPGTTMTFTGMQDSRERAALIAWLKRSAG